MKTMELRSCDPYFGYEHAQGQESEYFCHRGEPARRFSATYSMVMTDKDIDSLGWDIADWFFDIDTVEVKKEDFTTCMQGWANECLAPDNPVFPAIFELAHDEIYESYVKWMTTFRREYWTCEDEEEEDEVDE